MKMSSPTKKLLTQSTTKMELTKITIGGKAPCLSSEGRIKVKVINYNKIFDTKITIKN
jgi:hypothetical protein